MRISDWRSDVCSSDLRVPADSKNRHADHGRTSLALPDRLARAVESHSLRPRQWAVRALPSPAWSARIPLGRRTVVGHGSSAMASRARKEDQGEREGVGEGKRGSVRLSVGGWSMSKKTKNR